MTRTKQGAGMIVRLQIGSLVAAILGIAFGVAVGVACSSEPAGHSHARQNISQRLAGEVVTP